MRNLKKNKKYFRLFICKDSRNYPERMSSFKKATPSGEEI